MFHGRKVHRARKSNLKMRIVLYNKGNSKKEFVSHSLYSSPLSRSWTDGRIKAALRRVYLLRLSRRTCPSHPPFTEVPFLTQQRPLTRGSLTHMSSTRNLEPFMKVGVSESHIKREYMNNSWSPARSYTEAEMIWCDFYVLRFKNCLKSKGSSSKHFL